MACFSVFVVLLTVFMEDGPDEEIGERHKWCEEHHPNLTVEECSNEAGTQIDPVARGRTRRPLLQQTYASRTRARARHIGRRRRIVFGIILSRPTNNPEYRSFK